MVTLLVVFAAVLAGTGRSGTGTVPAPAVSPGGTHAPPSASPDVVDLPVRLTIPTIGVSTVLTRLGLNKDNTVQVPKDPAEAGWYEFGTAPGQPGSAVVLGHVDSAHGPAVFAKLHRLKAGDRVQVRLAGDRVATFVVAKVKAYANADFPAQQVYAGTTKRSELNLVTCGGVYDESRGGYQSNVVVFTRHMETVPAA